MPGTGNAVPHEGPDRVPVTHYAAEAEVHARRGAA